MEGFGLQGWSLVSWPLALDDEGRGYHLLGYVGPPKQSGSVGSLLIMGDSLGPSVLRIGSREGWSLSSQKDLLGCQIIIIY